MLRTALPLIVLLLASLPTGKAHAVFDGDLIRIFAVGDIGFGGTMEDDTFGASLDLAPTYGFAAGADVGLHDFVAVGLLVGYDWVKPADDAIADLTADAMAMAMAGGFDAGAAAEDALLGDRSSLLDIAIYPRVRLPLPIIEPYVMVPVGLATLTPPEGEASSGMSLGVTGGLGLTMFPFVKLIAEVGYQMYFLDGVDIAETRVNAGLAVGF